jgi:hypothetical protein
MNVDRLRDAEAQFLLRYPGGFANEEMQAILRKRHNVGRLSEFATEALAEQRFNRPAALIDDLVRIVSRSSMVSMFEKPKYRDYVQGLARGDREQLLRGYRDLLHGDQERGFNAVLDVLHDARLAKWSLVTIHLYHYRPGVEVFVKPTTTKNVIRQFEIPDLVYRPRPSWPFYARYRTLIGEMKSLVNQSLAPNNAAFTGFLMLSSGVRAA